MNEYDSIQHGHGRKENSLAPDFVGIFRERLGSLFVLSPWEGRSRAWELEEIGITQLKKKAWVYS